jgi:hypothetical protein
MATYTTRLNATKPASSENVDVTAHLSNNFDLFDAAVAATVGASSAKPASAFSGRLWYETDTNVLKVNTAASASTAAVWERAVPAQRITVVGGTSNDTAEWQAAINEATALSASGSPYGGIIEPQPGNHTLGQIVLKDRVQILGSPLNHQGYRELPVRLIPHSSIPNDGYMFSASGTINNVVLAGLASYGGGSATKTGWANLPNADNCTFQALSIDNWGIEALILGGNNNRVSYALLEGMKNTAYAASGATIRGAFTVSGADHQISHNEFTGPNYLAVSGVALRCVAAKSSMSSSEVDHNVFQLGDVGLNVTGGLYNRFTANRFDFNAGHGLLLDGGSYMTFTGNSWNHNSSASANTYDHVNVPASAGGSPMLFSNMLFTNESNSVRYWINDGKNHATFRNVYVDPHGEDAGTANTNITGNSIVNQPSLTASSTWDPGSLGNGVAANTTITVTNAAVGDTVLATHSSVETAATSWILTGYVSAANTVRVVLLNVTGGTVDLASGTLRVRVFKKL